MGRVDDHTLQRLVYRSTALIDPDDHDGLRDIARSSDTNNSRMGITGCLTLAEGTFVQVLEGSSDRLHGLMGRVLADRRHRCVDILSERPITGRLFKSWGMGLITVPPSSLDLVQIVTRTGGAAHVTGILLGLLEGDQGTRGMQRV